MDTADFFCQLAQHGNALALIVGEQRFSYRDICNGAAPLELLDCLQRGQVYRPVSPRQPPDIQAAQRAELSAVPNTYTTALYTSGSSGQPKIALHQLEAHWINAIGSLENLKLAPGDRWLCSLPLFHVGGLGILFRCFAAGATAVLPAEGCRDLATCISRYEITHISVVATQLRRLLDSACPSALKAILVGGSAIPESLLKRAANLPLFRSYGLTEMSSQVCTTLPGMPTSSGHLLPFRELRILNGEILVRGPCLFAGYWRGDTLERAVDADGWFHSKDQGFVDAGGALHVTGRLDNLFISGGENIQAEEVEAALLSFPSIEQAVVVPVDDEEYGQRPLAFIDPLSPPAAADLDLFLARFKQPIAYQQLPTQGGLKPSRKQLKELAAASFSR